MTTHRPVQLYLALVISLLFSGCLDIDVHTIINSDGSSERTISIKRETKQIPDGVYPWAGDSTWTVTWKELPDKNTSYECTATKSFPTPDALTHEYSSRPDTGVIRLNVSLTKRFEWFYTYFDYREVYTMHNSNVTIPVSAFLSPAEVERYVRGDNSDTLKAKVKKWDNRNGFEIFFRSVVEEARKLNDPSLPPSLFTQNKERLFQIMVEVDTQKNVKKTGRDSTQKNDEEIGRILAEMKTVLRTDAVVKLTPVIRQVFDRLVQGERPHPDTWTSAVRMPGLLLETNSEIVEGSLVSWKFSADQIHVGDYVMTAESRSLNIWAFVITGAAALFLLLALFLRGIFRRQNRLPAS